MQSTLRRWPVLIVALLVVLLCQGRSEAQRRPGGGIGGGGIRPNPNPNPGGAQFGGQFGGNPGQFGGNPGGQFGGNPGNDPWAGGNDPFANQPRVGGATNAQVERATRTATGGMIAVGIVSVLIGLAIFGAVGWLVAMNNKHSSAPSSSGGSRRRR